MKTQEEIEAMANNFVSLAFSKQDLYDGFINGYFQCQQDMADKKYTLKQVERYHDIRATQGIKNANNYINSLNKQD